MAQHTEVRLVDDLSGDPADETLKFTWDGVPMEIDLTTANATRLRDSLAEFVSAARRASGGGRPARRAQTTGDREYNQSVRAWAKARGIKVAERGRISADVLQAYERGDAAVAS